MSDPRCKAKRYRDKSKCYPHWRRDRATRRAWFAKEYARRKSSGLCVASGCKERAAETLACSKHQALQRRSSSRYLAKPEIRRKATEATRRWNDARAKLGLCLRCSREVFRARHCEKHWRAEVARDEAKRRRAGRPVSKAKCDYCDKPGHRYETCEEKLRVNLDDFATARPGGFTMPAMP
jgi:hypothetical protein